MTPPERRARPRSAPHRPTERLAALFIAGVLMLNFPLLALFSGELRLLGVPLLYVYLLLAWALLIGCIAVLLRRRPVVEHRGDAAHPGAAERRD